MRHVREVLRLRTAGISGNEIARRLNLAPSTVRLGNRNRNRHEGEKSPSRSGSLSSGYRWFEAISLQPRVRQPTPPRTVTIEIVRIGLGGAAICPRPNI